jgi:hypothetical protein
VLCVLVGLFALSVAPVRAAVTHKYVSQFSDVPAGGGVALPGPVTAMNSMTVDGGRLFVAENVEGTGGTRVDVFDAASDAFVSQFPQVPSLSYLFQGVAVNHVTGEVYVGADRTVEGKPDGAVAVFSSAGSFLGAWTGADTPSESKDFGCFDCSGSGGVAVDNSVGGPASGSVYVLAVEQRVVDVFKPEMGGKEPLAGGVSQLKGTCPVEGTACEPAEVVPFNSPSHVAVDASTGRVLVVDTVREEVEGHVVQHEAIDVFEPQLFGGFVFVRQITIPTVSGTGVAGLAVDGGTGEIYVATGQLPGFVYEFSAAGVLLGRIVGADTPGGDLRTPTSVAIDPESHRVFIGDKREARGQPGVLDQPSVVDVFGADLVIPDVITGPATSLKPGSATLTGTVRLDKEGEATCQFVWGTTPEFGHVAPCSAPVTVEESSVQANIGLTANEEALEPDTTYFYRLQATNKNGMNPSEPSANQHFTTPGPGIHEESASNVAATSVTLNATIDPNNASTTYFFQYGTSSAYGTDAPAPPGLLLGTGTGDVETSPLHLQGLTAGTVYHFRAVAVSELEPGVFVAFDGSDSTFTTQAAGVFSLPDGRAWEMVSPADKHGALIYPIDGELGTPIQASVNGDAMSFTTDAPTEAEPLGYGGFSQTFSTRGVDGWSSRDIKIAHSIATGAPISGGEYQFFSEDLSLGMVQPFGRFEPSLSSEASEQTAYLRTDYEHGDVSEPCSVSCWRPLVTGKPGLANVPSGTVFGESISNGECPPGLICGPEFLNGTPDLSHVLFSSTVALTPGLTPDGKDGLYEWSRGKLQFVSVLPGNNVASDYRRETVGNGHLMSDDGSRIVWGNIGESHLYVRDTVKNETVQLDAVQGGTGTGTVRAHFVSLSSDGSKVFFTDPQHLTGSAGQLEGIEQPDLYECEIVEVAGKLACSLSDLTPPGAKERADVQGGMDASKDGSYIYFVANGVLAPGARPGGCHVRQGVIAGALCNLYVRHGGTTQLVAVLSSSDEPDFKALPANRTSKVSADGQWLAFMSQRALTGYDNRDAVSGKPDEEVYLYNATSDRLVCASCNPTGARPVGVEDRDSRSLIDQGVGSWRGSWLAANIPGWTPRNQQSAIYQSRYLSDSGRLFFNSHDALVPQDVNGQQDVYQYEPPGVGDCTIASAKFSVRSGGCVGLISAGASAEESAFLDASGSGGDVFFLTSAKLASQDYDTALDVYDAHECSGSAPCFAASAVLPPACSTGDSCKPSPSPQPAVFGSPSSATFSGAGNVTQSISGVLKAKSLTRAQKLGRALKACHKKRQVKRKRACERQARARYSAKRSSRISTKIGRG